MMKRFVWISMAILLHACTEHKGYTVRGKLADADGLKVTLVNITADSASVTRDSCTVKNGKFEMKGTVDYPEYCGLYAGDNGPLRLFVENSVIDVAFNLKNIHRSKVTGSGETDLLVQYDGKMAEFEKSFVKVNDGYMAMKLSGKTDTIKEKEYMAQFEMIKQQRVDYMKLFAAEHPNRMTTALVVGNSLSYYIEPEELLSYTGGFDSVMNRSPWVKRIRDKAAGKQPAEPAVKSN